jgi:hypothetical protein
VTRREVVEKLGYKDVEVAWKLVHQERKWVGR